MPAEAQGHESGAPNDGEDIREQTEREHDGTGGSRSGDKTFSNSVIQILQGVCDMLSAQPSALASFTPDLERLTRDMTQTLKQPPTIGASLGSSTSTRVDASQHALLGATSTRLNASQHAPLDQGEQGTCVACAFAQALATGIQAKYGLALDKHAIFTQVKALVPCWDGHDPAKIVEEWNARHKEDGASIEDIARKCRYNVVVDARKIEDFDAACFEMKMAEYMKMFMTCKMKTDTAGHEYHSVALIACMPSGKELQALNSWGPRNVHMEVSDKNFVYAMTFDVRITRVGDKAKSFKTENFYKERKRNLPSEAARWLLEMNASTAASVLRRSDTSGMPGAGAILDAIVEKDLCAALHMLDSINTKEASRLMCKMQDNAAKMLLDKMGVVKAVAAMNDMESKKAGAVLEKMDNPEEIIEGMCANAAARVLSESSNSWAARLLDQIPVKRAAVVLREMGNCKANDVLRKIGASERVQEEMDRIAHDNGFPASCQLDEKASSAIRYLEVDLARFGRCQGRALELLRKASQGKDYRHFVLVGYVAGKDYCFAATRTCAEKLQSIAWEIQDAKHKGQCWKGESLGTLIHNARDEGTKLGKTYAQVQAEMALISDDMLISWVDGVERKLKEAQAATLPIDLTGEVQSMTPKPDIRPAVSQDDATRIEHPTSRRGAPDVSTGSADRSKRSLPTWASRSMPMEVEMAGAKRKADTSLSPAQKRQ